ncbi:8-oxo-dGDP phosphatase NUDT18 isoform X2 [Rhinatrema bivittatum]|uniref:8-oxo-dGDP phosphatase NUDT18 isoform X2 n=1 Tax=Rhinatrema bivittatum TaxID=194408 RepID=UPI001129C58B|nr:8-oxo-dGDP phosphatase NUDT18 isoform X2 [Rhinatrema bivittatum]
MDAGQLETELQAVLDGHGLPVPDTYDAAPESLEPVVLRKNVCYIVLGILLNEQGEVLMIQEAKRACYGKWYLPAGRMELGETILEALKREVKEETGLECEPGTLLVVEERGPCWIRFTFLAEPKGGFLKAAQDADAESLQAKWWDRESPLPLRGKDILPLIDVAVRYRANPWHPITLPKEMPCSVISQRVVATFVNSSKDLWVLQNTVGKPHLPVTVCNMSPTELRSSIKVAIYRLIKQCILLPQVQLKTHGILGLQHLGKDPVVKCDGVCFNVLVTVTHANQRLCDTPPELHGEDFQWLRVEEGTLKSALLQRLSTFAVVPIYS